MGIDDRRGATRRQVLGSLAALGMMPGVAWGGAAVERRWRGRGHITVLATGHGDPRVPPGVDRAQALALADELADERTLLVAATGVPIGPDGAPDDAARELARKRPDQAWRDQGSEGFGDVMGMARVAWGLSDPNNGVFRARRAALARAPFDPEHRSIEEYLGLRGDAFARMEEARSALAAQRTALVEGLPRKAVVVVKALGAGALCAELEAAGRGGELTATDEARTLLDGEELFWAGLEAGLPEPGGEGLAPWARSGRSFVEAFGRWSGREAFTKGIAAQGEDTPLLTGPLRAQVDAAAELLSARGLMDWPADLAVHEGPSDLHAMSYDGFTHRLKVAPVVEELSVPLTAAVLLHELVHVADVAAAATILGTDHRGVALLIDRLPVGIGTGMLCSMEDHAYHREVLAVPALGLRVPDGTIEAEGSDAERRVLRMLAMLMATGPGHPKWLGLVDKFVGLATEKG